MNSEQEEEIGLLLERIVKKGSFWAVLSKTTQKKNYDPNQFLIECYEQVNSESVQKIWGNELIDDIIEYNVKYNGKSREVEPTVITLGDKTIIYQYKQPTMIIDHKPTK